MGKLKSLQLQNIGRIKKAEVHFGDLTVFVGPQATGKSIFLQFLKLAVDKQYIHEQLRKHGIEWGDDVRAFLDVYLGEGMQGIWQAEGENKSSIWVDGRLCPIHTLITGRRPKKGTAPVQRVFYIPAQRVLSLANGWPRPFQGFSSQDPFAVRDFSETFRLLMEQEFIRSEELFPKTNRLKKPYRDLLSKHLFAGFGLYVDRHGAQKRLVLQRQDHQENKGPPIPFMAWSAGQREFIPLLMGLYWLMTAGNVRRRADIQWVIMEELEMGLHPDAIAVVLLLVLELLWRGYRVCLSTHSTHVLNLVWAIQELKKSQSETTRLLDIFKVRKSDPLKEVAEAVGKKEIRVYYFDYEGKTHDISGLDPGTDEQAESGWGGLTDFSSRVNDMVAKIVASSFRQSRSPSLEKSADTHATDDLAHPSNKPKAVKPFPQSEETEPRDAPLFPSENSEKTPDRYSSENSSSAVPETLP
jgi:hypothetical protein